MPYITRWVPAEIFLIHNGVSIYHTYRSDDIEEGAYNYHYTTVNDEFQDADTFDVRELSTWKEPDRDLQDPLHQVEQNAIKDAIIAAIDKGELTNPQPDEDLSSTLI